MTTTNIVTLSILAFLVCGMLGFICNRLACIVTELRKQTKLSIEARDFVKARSRPPVMHDQPKVTYS